MSFDKTFKVTFVLCVIAGFVTMVVSFLLSKGDMQLSMTLGVVISVAIFTMYYLLSSAGDSFFSNIFGTGRHVDGAVMAAESLAEKASNNEINNRFEEAIVFHKELLYNDKNSFPEKAAYNIGRLYDDKLLKHKEAIYWYRKAIALSCRKENSKENHFALESQNALNKVAKLLNGQADTTLEDLTKIKKLIEEKKYEGAFEKLTDAQKLYPDNSEVNYLFAHYYLFQNNLGMAVEHFSRTLAIDPGHLLALYFKAGSLKKMGHLLEARDCFKEYLVLAKDHPGEKARLSTANTHLEKIEDALSTPTFDGPGRP